MRYADLFEAQQRRAALLELIIHHPGGWSDSPSLAKAGELCRTAIGAVEDAECAAHIDAVAQYARALFSERAHREWHRGNMRGADFLRLEIVRALHALNRRLCALETERREADTQSGLSMERSRA